MKPLLTLTIAFLILLAPAPAFAQNNVSPDGIYTGGGLIPCGQNMDNKCNSCHVVVLANTVIKWLIGITFMIFAGMAVYAGVKMVMSGGNSHAKEDAKEMFTNAFIGLLIILGAWLMIDTLLRYVLKNGQNGNIAGYGPWSQVECVEETTPGITQMMIDEAEFSGNYYVPSYASSGTGAGGSCSVITDTNNPCHPTNLSKYFGARAEEASKICNKESGGRIVNSRTDICCGTNGCQSGEPSFSGGVFQINVLANGGLIPGCRAGSFYKKNGTKTAQGDCVQRNSKGICTGWSCEIIDQAMYNTCMQATRNVDLNLQIAGKLFQQSGGFGPWNWSRRLCGIP